MDPRCRRRRRRDAAADRPAGAPAGSGDSEGDRYLQQTQANQAAATDPGGRAGSARDDDVADPSH